MRRNLVVLTVTGVAMVALAVYNHQTTATNSVTAANTTQETQQTTPVQLADVTNMNPSAGGEGGPVPEPSSSTTGNPSTGVEPAVAPGQPAPATKPAAPVTPPPVSGSTPKPGQNMNSGGMQSNMPQPQQ
jgi:hypothetical protein